MVKPLPSSHVIVGSFIIKQISTERPPCARHVLGTEDTAIKKKIAALIYIAHILVEGQKQ